MIKLYLDKLYRYDRVDEHMWVAVPVKKGRLYDANSVFITDGNSRLASQIKITSRYEDGSIRFMFVRFVGTLPGNDKKEFELYLDEADYKESKGNAGNSVTASGGTVNSDVNNTVGGISIKKADGVISIDTGAVSFSVKDYSENVFEGLSYGGKSYAKEDFYGPVLKDGLGNTYGVNIDEWKIVEEGQLCTVLKASGTNISGGEGCEEGSHIRFEIKITAYAGKSWLDMSYRIINTSEQPLHVASLVFAIKGADGKSFNPVLANKECNIKIDSTGCSDINLDLSKEEGPVFNTIGIGDLAAIEEKTPVETVRTCAGSSNYRTNFLIGKNGSEVVKIAEARALLMESNEHYSEVFYGTFFADRTDAEGGVCATIYQAQQNYPKAVKADDGGLYVMLVPEGIDKVVMQPGTSREQMFQLFFHAPSESLVEIDNRSLIYQMPDRPVLDPKVYKESGAMTDVFADRFSRNFEIMLIGKADAHSRSFGMMNWGDTVDWNYTNQGRGGGEPVWSNNEYDYPHACALMYARSGIRRFLDYCIVHARHWMDVDVCHYSSDPLRIGGQIEHTKGHVQNGVLVPSHEWVEGLLDYYHFTGDERGLQTAIGIGDNVLRLLETPAYQKTGEANARETGWALRTLTALYVETNDKKWIEKCEWIVGHFIAWKETYGNWVAPYTDNTLIRVGFMISVAVGSLMRYYKVFPSEGLKALIMDAVEDVRENCLMDCGLFYYKELPSLARLGNNNLLLEAMAAGYELTGDKKYLEAGVLTLKRTLMEQVKVAGGAKKIIGDAMVTGTETTKGFGQSFYPLAVYYKYLVEAGLDDFIDRM